MTDTDIPDELRPRGLDDHERLNDPRYRLLVANQTIAALRRELAEAHSEINDILPELDAVRSMGTQLERELAARTEERDQWRREATARGAATIKAEEERDAAQLALKYARAALDSRRSVIP